MTINSTSTILLLPFQQYYYSDFNDATNSHFNKRKTESYVATSVLTGYAQNLVSVSLITRYQPGVHLSCSVISRVEIGFVYREQARRKMLSFNESERAANGAFITATQLQLGEQTPCHDKVSHPNARCDI